MKKYLLVFVKLLMFAVIATLSFPRFAQAYLDPGSGSYILQIMFGVLFGASYLVKVYWGKIKSFFGKTPTEEISSNNEDD